jgi:hypothetical protein
MTGRALSFSRREMSELFEQLSLLETEGAGKAEGRPGAGWHPWSACNKKARGRTTGSAEITRPSLRNGFTAYT